METESELWSSMSKRGLVAVDKAHYAALKESNADMLKALEAALKDFQSGFANISTYDLLFAAIAKAKELI